MEEGGRGYFSRSTHSFCIKRAGTEETTALKAPQGGEPAPWSAVLDRTEACHSHSSTPCAHFLCPPSPACQPCFVPRILAA